MPLQIPDQTIASQVNIPDPMKPISGFLNIAQMGQNLKTSQLDYDIKDVANQKRNQLRDIAAKSVNPDGTFNQQAFSSHAPQADPEQGLQLANNALSNQSQSIANTTNQFSLDKSHYQTAAKTASGLMQDPRITASEGSYSDKDAAEAITEAQDQMIAQGVPKAQALLAVAPLAHSVHTPGAVRQQLANIISGQLSPESSAAQNLLPASQQQSPGTDSNGNPITVMRDQFGQMKGVQGSKVDGGAATPPNIIPAGESPQSMNDLRIDRQKTLDANGKSGELHTYFRNTIQMASDPALANPNSYQGKGQAFAAKFGFPVGTDYKTVLDTLSHNIALTTMANEKAMGVTTDAGRHTSELANGGMTMTPDSLANASKMGDATVTGLEAYTRGQEAAIAKSSGNVAAKRNFQYEWSKVYTPVVTQMYNAAKSGDTAEIESLARKSGYTGDMKNFATSSQGKDLTRRAQIMENLSKTGSP